MDAPVFNENTAIEHARALLQKECGVSLPRDDAVLLVYLLARQGIRDAIDEAQGLGSSAPEMAAYHKSSTDETQALDDLAAEVGELANRIQASIGTTVDHCLAVLMANVEKSIDTHLEQVVDDCAVRLRAETLATFRTKWFWIAMLLTGALCFGLGVVTVLMVASARF